jgi:hypothetical protein
MVCSQRHAPAALPLGKTRYPLYRRLRGPQGRSGRVRKISSPTGIRSPDRPARSELLYRLSYPGPPSHSPCTNHIRNRTVPRAGTIQFRYRWWTTQLTYSTIQADSSLSAVQSSVFIKGDGGQIWENNFFKRITSRPGNSGTNEFKVLLTVYYEIN